MKVFRAIDRAFLVLLTILLVYDYFPNIFIKNIIPSNVCLLLIIVLFLVSLILKRYRSTDNLEIFKYHLFSTIYIFLLMLLLNVLGGQSMSGISFKEGGFWIVLSISGIEIFYQLKKVKEDKTNKFIS